MKNLVFLAVLVTVLGSYSVEALEACTYENGTIHYCPDYGYSIGYCCERWDVDLCCFYTPVYFLWYFWTPLVLFIVGVSICMCACRACSKRSSTTPANSMSSRYNQQYGADVERSAPPAGVVYQATVAQVQIGAQPPSYDEVRNSQAETLEGYQHQQETKPKKSPSSSSSSSSEDEAAAK